MGLNYPKDAGTEWMQLKRDVKSAFTSANSRQPYKKIGAGVVSIASSLTVLAGAFMKFVWPSGNDGAYLGRFSFQGEPHDGMIIYNQANKFKLTTVSRVSDNYSYTAMWDNESNIVVSDDAASGRGLARPWIHIPVVVTSELANPPAVRQTSNTTDTALVSALAPMQHPRLQIWFYIYIQTSPATAEIKVKDVTTGDTLTSVTAGSGYQKLTFDMPNGWDFGSDHQIDITARRASGSGNVGVTVLSLTGRQS